MIKSYRAEVEGKMDIQTPEYERRIMYQDYAEGLGVPRLKDGYKELHDMEVHVLQPKASHVEEKTALVIWRLHKNPETLDIVQNVCLHGVPRLSARVMFSNPNNVDETILFVFRVDVALTGAVLRDEALVVRRGFLLQAHAFACVNDGLGEVPLEPPVDG